ncbi:MAG: hypothetical protein ACK5KM_15880 [Hyphomicrobiaceae bacterium]
MRVFLLAIFAALTLAMSTCTRDSTVTISCANQMTQGQAYCLFHRTRAGLFGRRYSVIIGMQPNRGLFFGIPWGADKVAAAWQSGTDQLTVSMPGTQLIIERDQYIDRR